MVARALVFAFDLFFVLNQTFFNTSYQWLSVGNSTAVHHLTVRNIPEIQCVHFAVIFIMIADILVCVILSFVKFRLVLLFSFLWFDFHLLLLLGSFFSYVLVAIWLSFQCIAFCQRVFVGNFCFLFFFFALKDCVPVFSV